MVTQQQIFQIPVVTFDSFHDVLSFAFQWLKYKGAAILSNPFANNTFILLSFRIYPIIYAA